MTCHSARHRQVKETAFRNTGAAPIEQLSALRIEMNWPQNKRINASMTASNGDKQPINVPLLECQSPRRQLAAY